MYFPMNDMVTPEQLISGSMDDILESIPGVKKEISDYEDWRRKMGKLLGDLAAHKVSPEEVNSLILEGEGMPERIIIAISEGIATSPYTESASWRYEVVMENGNEVLKKYLQLNFGVEAVKEQNENLVEKAAPPLG